MAFIFMAFTALAMLPCRPEATMQDQMWAITGGLPLPPGLKLFLRQRGYTVRTE